MVTVPWGSIATFPYSRIWNFSTVLAKKKFRGGNFLNLQTVCHIRPTLKRLAFKVFSGEMKKSSKLI